MAIYYVLKHDTAEVLSNLTVSDLKEMAQTGRLAPNDKIKKSGHTTWHLAEQVIGLGFCEPSTTATTSESHAQSVRHDEQIYNVQSETIAEISEQINTHANEFEIFWPDGRQDGPFAISTIQQLMNDGFVNQACQFKEENEHDFRSFASLNLIDTNAYEFEICWPDGRQDGPFSISKIQQLTSDGFVNQSCQFRAEDEIDFRSFASINLIDTQPEPRSTPITHQQTGKTLKQKKAVKEKPASKKVRREKTPMAKGWFRRFVVKSVSAIVIIAAVIALGSWGVWTAMSDSQKEMARNKYETIKKSFEDDFTESVVATDSSSVVNSSQANANTNTGSNSMASTGRMQANANISVPEFGPLWVHEELRLPVLGNYNSFAGLFQVLLATPRSPIEGELEIKSFYSAEQFGEPKWFQVPARFVFQRLGDQRIAGIGGSGEGNPDIDSNSIKVLRVATAMGIHNQKMNRSALVRSWLDMEGEYGEQIESHVDDASSGNIDRVAIKNGASNISFFQFDRDAKKRVVAINAYDSAGNTLGPYSQFEYAVDNTLSQFSISTPRGWTIWTPVYNNGALASLDGILKVQKDSLYYGILDSTINYHISYEYDSVGRITNIVYTNPNVETSSNPLSVETVESEITASFVYKNYNEHWSTATVSSSWSKTIVRGLNPPQIQTRDYGTVRFEQSLNNITKQ